MYSFFRKFSDNILFLFYNFSFLNEISLLLYVFFIFYIFYIVLFIHIRKVFTFYVKFFSCYTQEFTFYVKRLDFFYSFFVLYLQISPLILKKINSLKYVKTALLLLSPVLYLSISVFLICYILLYILKHRELHTDIRYRYIIKQIIPM